MRISRDSKALKRLRPKWAGYEANLCNVTARLKEHQNAVSLCNKRKLSLSEDVCQSNPTIEWNNSEIITANRPHRKRLCLEAWYVNAAQAEQ